MKKLGLLLFMSSGIAYGMGDVKRSLAERYAGVEHHRTVSYDSFLVRLRQQNDAARADRGLKAQGRPSNPVDPKNCGSGAPVRRKKNQNND